MFLSYFNYLFQVYDESFVHLYAYNIHYPSNLLRYRSDNSESQKLVVSRRLFLTVAIHLRQWQHIYICL